MTWRNRLQEAAYTSPSGTRIRFAYESVSRDVDKRTTAFEFPGVDDSYVQQSGHSSRKYDMRCFFVGDDHDLQATAFEAALLERGIGRLEHPLYGTFDVVPFGSISRRDDLKSSANQSVIQVAFWTTTGAVYPTSQFNPEGEIREVLDGFDVAASQQFADSVDLDTEIARANEASVVRAIVGTVRESLAGAAEATAEVRQQFSDAQKAINTGVDVLVGQPLDLATQMVGLVRAPARAAAGVRSRLEGYRDLAEDIIGSPEGSPELSVGDGIVLPRRAIQVSNDFHTSDLTASAAVTGSVLSVIESEFAARPEAIEAADEVASLFDTVVDWRDNGFDALGQVDTGGTYQTLRQAVALAAGFLVEVSFSLVPERRVVLDRPRTIIDLAAELYGSVDDRLDFLITTNSLTGSEILELPAGRSIVYYP